MSLKINAVMLPDENIFDLKRKALLFDSFYIYNIENFLDALFRQPHLRADLEFLLDKGVVVQAPTIRDEPSGRKGAEMFLRLGFVRGFVMASEDFSRDRLMAELKDLKLNGTFLQNLAAEDYLKRIISTSLANDASAEFIPICNAPLGVAQAGQKGTVDRQSSNQTTVLRVALNSLPAPLDDTPWEDILNLRSELHNKAWDFRRWLKTIATKDLSASEIRDELEWLLKEYENAMKIHRIKSSRSLVDICVISPLEIVENLVKLNFTKLAKSLLLIEKRKVDLLEAEMKAPGRECAYVFDARRRFNRR